MSGNCRELSKFPTIAAHGSSQIAVDF